MRIPPLGEGRRAIEVSRVMIDRTGWLLGSAALAVAAVAGCGGDETASHGTTTATGATGTTSSATGGMGGSVHTGGAAGAGGASAGGGGGSGGAASPAGCVEGSFTAYRGNFHAHTSFSDGEGEPADAFAMARDVAGLDIMVVTDHLEQLYWVPPTDRYGECQAQADEANESGSFITGCGFEYGSGFSGIESTGHNNVFYSPALFPMVQLDFHDFYASLAGCPSCVGQFNHPGDEPQYWNEFEYDAPADERMSLYELSGGGPAWDLFFVALDAGWHLSPMFNQDNHSANWGTANEGRSGVFMAELTREALAEALAAGRTFASVSDENAALRMMAAGTCWMGSVLSGAASVQIEVHAEDPDPGDGFTAIELFGPGQSLRATEDCSGATSCDAALSITVSAAEYVVARAVQSDGNHLVAAPIWLAP